MPRPPHREGEDFIGQKQVFTYTRTIYRGAIQLGRTAPPLLFFGPPGCGKTSSAGILAKEFGSKFHTIFGSRDVTPAVLIGRIRDAKHGDVIFIDEVHSLPKTTQETLFLYIDKQKVPAINDDGRVDATRLESAAATNLILATTWAGQLLAPLLNRVDIVRFQPYSIPELKTLVEAHAERQNVTLTPQAARTLAERCQGSPRAAKRLTELLIIARPTQPGFTQADVEAWLREKGISRHGLTPIQTEYLFALAASPGRRSTLERLVARISGVDSGYVRRDVEPYLLTLGAVAIETSRLRILTDAGVSIVEELREEQEAGA